ncbi:MAG: ribosome assembly RNA-binding protein YhbY [Gammaproteobacteria bacterium]|nr:ribosome assembly RNA-binding protein YhbY [Gammaproteobacteria bacterium]
MTNPTLTEKQRKFLKGLAHDRKVIVQTGANGLTEAVLREISLALTAHELVKVKVLAGDHADRDAMVDEIVDETGAILIQRIGHVATLFKRNPDGAKIDLPKK